MKQLLTLLSILLLDFNVLGVKKIEHFLSFTMPCYNCSKTMRDSLDSIYAQDLQIPFEVVCTDDGSKDNTLQILREYEQKYPNFYVFVHEQNKGGGAANNTCVKNSQGDLIFRLDSDNILVPGSVKLLISRLDETGCDGAAFESMYFFSQKGQLLRDNKFEAHNNICDLAHFARTCNDPAASGNYLYTRKSYERAGGYPEKHGHDTFCFGFKQYATGARIALLPNSFYWHFSNPNGYCCRQEREGRTQHVTAMELFRDFSEVFTKEARKYFTHLSQTGCFNIFSEFGKKGFTLVAPEILQRIFKSYELEETGDIQGALYQLEQVVSLGHGSPHLMRRAADLLKKLNIS